MERMRHNKTDLHVLQWRHGCVVDEGANGSLKFVRGISEYAYDGTEFLFFELQSRLLNRPKKKWNEVPILNQYTKGYLEKECVDWLSKFMEYGKVEQKYYSSPDVYTFLKKSLAGNRRLTLTCLATGFYHKDINMKLRKHTSSVPEHLETSLGVRPNGDGTYQLRKSVEIEPEEKELYDCNVNHITFKGPFIRSGDVPCLDCNVLKVPDVIISGAINGLKLAVVVGIYMFLRSRIFIRCYRNLETWWKSWWMWQYL